MIQIWLSYLSEVDYHILRATVYSGDITDRKFVVLLLAATCTAEWPMLSTWFGSAPPSSRASTSSRDPASTALCRAVCWPLSGWLTRAPDASNARMISGWPPLAPLAATRCSGVWFLTDKQKARSLDKYLLIHRLLNCEKIPLAGRTAPQTHSAQSAVSASVLPELVPRGS